MEPVNFHMPGYRINEYLLVITLPEELRHKIGKVKDEFAEKYKVPSAKYLKPHIALVNYLALIGWSPDCTRLASAVSR